MGSFLLNKTIAICRNVTYETTKNHLRKRAAEFVRFISQKSSSENRKELNAKLSEQGKLIKRNEELNLLFKRLYDDNVLGKVTNEQFRMHIRNRFHRSGRSMNGKPNGSEQVIQTHKAFRKTKRTNSRNCSSFPPDCFCFS